MLAPAAAQGTTRKFVAEQTASESLWFDTRVMAASLELAMTIMCSVLDDDDQALRLRPQRHADLPKRFAIPADDQTL